MFCVCFLRSQPGLSSRGYQSGFLEAKKGIQGRSMACLEGIEIVCVCVSLLPRAKRCSMGSTLPQKHTSESDFSQDFSLFYTGVGIPKVLPYSIMGL